MADDHKCTTHYEFFNALRDVIIASDPAKLEALHNTIHDWSEHDPDNYFWAIGPQAPAILFQVMMEIVTACDPDATSKPAQTDA